MATFDKYGIALAKTADDASFLAEFLTEFGLPCVTEHTCLTLLDGAHWHAANVVLAEVGA